MREKAGNDVIDRYDTATGALTGSIAGLPGDSWGVAVNPVSSDIYFTTVWFGNSGGVYKAAFATSTFSNVVLPDSNGRSTHYVSLTWAKDGLSFASTPLPAASMATGTWAT